MPEYKVMWEIDIEADTPTDAAIEAKNIQLDPKSTANTFIVADESKKEIYQLELVPEQDYSIH
jgi:hypothetical protein